MHHKINAKAGVGNIGEKFFCIISQTNCCQKKGHVVTVGQTLCLSYQKRLKGRVQSNLIVKKAVNESERRQHDDGIQAD